MEQKQRAHDRKLRYLCSKRDRPEPCRFPDCWLLQTLDCEGLIQSRGSHDGMVRAKPSKQLTVTHMRSVPVQRNWIHLRSVAKFRSKGFPIPLRGTRMSRPYTRPDNGQLPEGVRLLRFPGVPVESGTKCPKSYRALEVYAVASTAGSTCTAMSSTARYLKDQPEPGAPNDTDARNSTARNTAVAAIASGTPRREIVPKR